MIKLLKTTLGYCVPCGMPGLIGRFRIVGWNHELSICPACIRKMANDVEADDQWRTEHA